MLQRVSKASEDRSARLSHYRRLKPHVPVRYHTAPRKALEWLFPWSEYTYPGQWKGFSGVLGSSVESMRHWLAGRRVMPRAVRDRLIEAIRGRLEAGHAVLAELEAMTDPVKKNPIEHIQRGRAKRLEAEKQLDKP